MSAVLRQLQLDALSHALTALTATDRQKSRAAWFDLQTALGALPAPELFELRTALGELREAVESALLNRKCSS